MPSLGVRLGVAATAAILLLVPFALLTVLVVGNWAPLYDLDRTGRRAALWIAAIMIPVLTALTVAVLLLAMIALGLFVTNAWHQGFPPSRAQVRGIEPVVWCGARGGGKIPHGRAPGHQGWKVVPRQEEL